jgi:hypothetical protein
MQVIQFTKNRWKAYEFSIRVNFKILNDNNVAKCVWSGGAL